jgi:hypothetical protein
MSSIEAVPQSMDRAALPQAAQLLTGRQQQRLFPASSHKLCLPGTCPPALHLTLPCLPPQQAEHMMEMAECKDNRLTLAHMLEVPHAFYGVVNDEDHTEL